MTIVNTTVHEDRVLILTNSAVAMQGGGVREVPRLFALPHIGSVMTGIGDATMLGAFWIRLTLGPTPFASFDAVADGFGPALHTAHRGALAAMRSQGTEPGEDIIAFSVIVAGYSATRGRILAHRFAAEAEFEPETIEEGTLAHPADPAWIDELYSPDLSALRRLATRQLQWMAAGQPEVAAGGTLIGAVITRDRITIEQLTSGNDEGGRERRR